MTILDVFNQDAFGVVSLTLSINKLPWVPSRLGKMGLFAGKGVPSTTVAVEERHNTLSLVSTQPRGSRGETASRRARNVRNFTVPHLPTHDAILADDVQGIRAFGSESNTEAVSTLVNDIMGIHKQNHEITWEWHRVGALKGEVLDADGTTTIYNWFTEFGITQDSVSFDFGTSTDGYLKKKALTIKRLIRDALGGTGYRKIHAMCGDQFFDNFVSHAEVADSYGRHSDNSFARSQQDGEGGFEWGGIVWENYSGGLGTQKFFDDDKATFFPVGAPDIFIRRNAPADYMEAVNTPGKPMYAKKQNMDFDKGVELEMQSNPLFMCTRPKCLIEGTDDT